MLLNVVVEKKLEYILPIICILSDGFIYYSYHMIFPCYKVYAILLHLSYPFIFCLILFDTVIRLNFYVFLADKEFQTF